MNISIDVQGDERLRKKLDSISKERLKYWIAFAQSEVAHDFADYVRQSWLSGQALNANEQSDVWTSLKPWTRKKDKTVFIRPGVGVPGMLNYLARWDEKSGHEFMKPAWMRWHGSTKAIDAVYENVDRMMERVFEENE